MDDGTICPTLADGVFTQVLCMYGFLGQVHELFAYSVQGTVLL